MYFLAMWSTFEIEDFVLYASVLIFKHHTDIDIIEVK